MTGSWTRVVRTPTLRTPTLRKLMPVASVRTLISTLVPLTLAASPAAAGEAWPDAVNARYRLKFQGVEVGKLDFNSQTTASGYKISGGAQLKVLLGLFKIKTDGNATGEIGRASAGPQPQPKTYAFDWQGGKKKGAIRLGFEGATAKKISVEPPSEPSPETVPLQDSHKSNVYDPISAIMVLTRNDGKPCDKRVPVFDGKHRFDVVFSYKRQQQLATKKGAAAETAIVCHVGYVPIAGHKQKPETEAFAKNRDMEIMLRKVPGAEFMVPHTVSIPTSWGTATMVAESIELTTAKVGRIALRD